MDIRARQKDDVIILDLGGRIDADAAGLVESVGQCLRDGYADILCNFDQVEYVDYVGISALVLSYKDVINNNGRMKFCCVPVHVKNALCVAGLDHTIDHYPSEESALQAFQQDHVLEKLQKLQLRRRFKRLPLDLKIELKTKSGGSPVCLKAEILNLSAVGAYIFGCSGLKLGDDCILTLKLSSKDEPLELRAKVVWLPDRQVQPQMYPGVGVEFQFLSTALQQRLLDFIEKNLSRIVSEK
ncbi:MAG: STAS domain-containing protein [Candidatus Omnitrophota bacterium]